MFIVTMFLGYCYLNQTVISTDTEDNIDKAIKYLCNGGDYTYTKEVGGSRLTYLVTNSWGRGFIHDMDYTVQVSPLEVLC